MLGNGDVIAIKFMQTIMYSRAASLSNYRGVFMRERGFEGRKAGHSLENPSSAGF